MASVNVNEGARSSYDSISKDIYMSITLKYFIPLIFTGILACSSTCIAVPQANNRRTGSTKQTVNATGVASIQSGVTSVSGSPTTKAISPAQDLLKVTIGSSRASVTRDASYGVFADLENISSDALLITPNETVLVVQPEVSQPNACVDSEIGIFPAQPTRISPESKPSEIHLQPNEHYKVFWDLSGNNQSRTNCVRKSALRDFLGFVPGDYAFTVEGIAYTQAPAGQVLTAHTYTETTTLKVSISQISTAIAAFLGALLAYLVVALQPGHDFDRWRADLPVAGRIRIAGILIRNAFSAGLLGSAVTIVASRLSDTQFPVKVSVSDFWGALTIGFVAYFIGSRFINTIAGRLATPPNNPPANVAPPGGAPTGDSPAAKPAGVYGP
jgi:hypothetical protein